MKTNRNGSKKPARKPSKSKPLGELFGQSATSVCRALGKAGIKTSDVRAIMKAKKIGIADATVGIQTRAGVNGQRGEPATLTKEQLAELKALIPAASAN